MQVTWLISGAVRITTVLPYVRATNETETTETHQQAEFSKACTTLITNANAPDLIRKVLEQRNTILQMDKTDGESERERQRHVPNRADRCPSHRREFREEEERVVVGKRALQ